MSASSSPTPSTWCLRFRTWRLLPQPLLAGKWWRGFQNIYTLSIKRNITSLELTLIKIQSIKMNHNCMGTDLFSYSTPWPRCIKFAFEHKSEKFNTNLFLTNQNRALRTSVWFFRFAFKRKFYATGPLPSTSQRTNVCLSKKRVNLRLGEITRGNFSKITETVRLPGTEHGTDNSQYGSCITPFEI